MAKLPENLTLLGTGEDFVRDRTFEAIAADGALSDHTVLIEASMDVLNYFSSRPDPAESEDAQAIRLLGMRLFNDSGSAFRLLCSGYYQTAAMVIRDLIETVFLLGYFQLDATKIGVWRMADENTRKREFNPAKIRTALDDSDGFTSRKRETHYKMLCAMAAHPTYQGLQLLKPHSGDHHCGPFFDKATLEAALQELVKAMIQAGQHYTRFFAIRDKASAETKLRFMEIARDWMERHLGAAPPREPIAELRRLASQIWP
ncbi:hypothetical protein KXS07_10460 [Inquilinus limosus]|uniref:hypothetical protein n=1 Tax=Inquilinus limosus TaxID=171674 RepID=UPI003F185052